MNIPSFEKFDVHDDSAGPRWRKYLARYELLVTAMGIGTNPTKKRALLLHYAGEEVYDVFDTFTAAEKGDDTEVGYVTLKTSLTNYFEPKKNVDYETFVFRQARQEQGETTDKFCTRLRKLASTCEFTNLDRELKRQILQGRTSNRLRRRGLRDDLSLQDLLQQARTLELADARASEMERAENANAVQHREKTQKRNSSSKQTKKCGWCGGQRHKREQCPAQGKICLNCGKENHFANACRAPKEASKGDKPRRRPQKPHKVRQVEEQSDSSTDAESVFTVGKGKTPRVKTKLCGVETEFLVDSGATVNVIHSSTKQKVCPKVKLRQPCPRIQAYGASEPLQIAGFFEAEIRYRDQSVKDRFYVVECEKTTTNLLSAQTAQELGLVQFAFTVHMPEQVETAQKIADSFPKIFDSEFGKIKDVKIKLHIDENVHPVSQRTRRVPLHIRKSVEEELERLEKMDIIEKVSGNATPWVSPIVTVPKQQGGVRVCVDMREANKAIERERDILCQQ